MLKVNAVASKMIPSKSMAKFAYDSVKVSNLRKKMPLSKLLPANSTEKQFEKELNVVFAQVSNCVAWGWMDILISIDHEWEQELGIRHYTF